MLASSKVVFGLGGALGLALHCRAAISDWRPQAVSGMCVVLDYKVVLGTYVVLASSK